jgi:type IV pilus assembly protein PilA
MLFLAIRTRLGQDEKGLTLLELLIVVIIIGILAAIAIPAFLDARQRASRAAVQADLRNIAMQAETFFTDNQTYDGFERNALFTGYSRGDGVQLAMTAANTTATSFCVRGTHTDFASGEVWSYMNTRARQLDDVACP